MAKETTELQIKVTADAKGAVSGLAPVNAGLTELAANAEKTSGALDGLAGEHKVQIDDAEIKLVSEEIARLRVQMREGLRANPEMNTAPIRKQISGLRTTLKELQRPVDIPVDIQNVDQVTKGERAISDLGRVAAQAFPSLNNVGNAFTSVGKVSPVVVGGVAAIGAAFGTWKVAKLAADVQTTQLQLKALTGSTQAAATTFQELQKFAADTPFELNQVTAAARALLVAGKTPSQLPETLTQIGNVATATGVPLEQMSIVFEQMFTKGHIANEELLQLAEAGVPAYQTLAKQLNTTTAGVEQMAQKGQIGADQIDLLIKNLGNLFPTSMSDQAKSFNGQLSTLHDTAMQLGQGLGAQVLPEFQALAQSLQDLLGFVQKLPGPVKEIGAAFVTVAIAQKVFGGTIDKAGASLTGLRTKIAGATGVGGKFRAGLGGIASAFNPWTLAITGGVALLTIWAAKQAEAKRKVDELSQGIDGQTGKLNANGKAILANDIKGFADDAGKAGVSMDDLTKSLLGGNAAFNAQIDALQQIASANSLAPAAGTRAVVRGYNDTGLAALNLIDKLQAQRDTLNQATDAAKKNAAAQDVVKAATSGVTESTVEMNNTVSQTAKAYQSAIDGFNAFNDTVSGHISTIFDYQGARDDLNTSLAKGGTFAPTEDQGRKNWDALVKAGQTAADRIKAVLETRGAAAAQTVYNNERTTLHNMLTNAGVQSNRAWALVNDVLKSPHTMHVELSKVDRANVTAELARLNRQKAKIQASFDLPTGDVINQRISGVIGKASARIKPIDAKINADVQKLDPAKKQLNDAAKDRTAKISPKIDASSYAFAKGQIATLVAPQTKIIKVHLQENPTGQSLDPAVVGQFISGTAARVTVAAPPAGTTPTVTKLEPRRVPVQVSVLLDGKEIASHLDLQAPRLAATGVRRA